MTDPGQYTSFARKNIAPGVDIILGIKSGKSTAQAYRFSASKFTAKEAKAWLKEHDIKGGISFTPAGKSDDGKKAIPGEPHSPYANNQDPAAQYITPEEAKAKIAENSLSNVINTRKLIDPDYGVNAGSITLERKPVVTKGSGKVKGKGDDMQFDEGQAILKLCNSCGGTGEHSECAGRGCADCDNGYCPDCNGEGFGSGEEVQPISPKGKGDSFDLIHFSHYDSIPITPAFMIEPFKKTPEGFLKGRAVVTNVGVFEYKGPNGERIRELRLPEEVFDEASLESLKLKPVANNHPKEKINSSNVKKYQVGSMGNNPSKRPVHPDGSPILLTTLEDIKNYSDGFRLSNDVIITDQQTIQDVEEGKRALSCGYECDSVPGEPGAKWMGMPYDYIQRKIRHNHLAIVDVARAGDDAVIRLDSADPDSLVFINSNEEAKIMAKNFMFDGMEYQAEPEVITIIRQETKRADKAEKAAAEEEESSKKAVSEKEGIQKDAEKLKAENDTLKDENKKLKDELVEMKKKKGDSAEILAAVNTRVALVEQAKKIGLVEGKGFKNDSPDREIKNAVIIKLYPTANLKDKTEDYLNARYDSAIELAEIGIEASVRKFGHSDSGMSEQKEINSGTRNDAVAIAKAKNEKERYYQSRGLEVPTNTAQAH